MRKLKGKWKHIRGFVYENLGGVKIHIQGELVQKPGSTPLRVNQFDLEEVSKLMGNKKRGLMRLAEEKYDY